MCGILGAVAIRSSDLPAPATFHEALSKLAHRGPDDRGVWEDESATLGHRRLSILDLSSAGHQPMLSADGRYVVVFNGEVYNFQTLRVELERQGVAFRSQCDTEVLIELYAREGLGALERLRGMFAFAIWDRRDRELLLVRDRLGIKPLYYFSDGRSLAFSSELRALRHLPRTPTDLSREALLGYLMWGSVPTPFTMLEGVQSLRPATWLRWREGSVEEGEYWSIPHETLYHTRGEAIEALRPALQEAVRLRCIADVPVGAFLSGGVDSSAIVSLMRDAGQNQLRTLAIVFPGTELDEARFAEEVATKFETTHVVMPASEQLVLDSLDSFFDAMDQPTIDGVNTFIVSKLARDSGLAVALSGLGGDEVFGGYDTFRRARLLDPWLDYVPQRMRSTFARLGSRVHPKLAKLEAFDIKATAAAQGYLASRGLFSLRQATRLLSDERGLGHLENVLDQLIVAGQSSFHQTMTLELRRYMHDQLLRDTDVFGMAHSLEIRVPLLDHKVIEVVASTDEKVIIHGQHKALLRDALSAPLPHAAVHRAKMGFTFPFERWMRTTWRATIEAQLFSSASRFEPVLRAEEVERIWRTYLAGQLHWSRPWALYVLSRWLS